jgi:hypothetical protein
MQALFQRPTQHEAALADKLRINSMLTSAISQKRESPTFNKHME